MICEFWGATDLDSVEVTEKALRDAVRAGGATLVEIFVHRFSPYGISGIAVIAESHLAVHTWPELGYCAADFFTCGDSIDMNAIVRTLRDAYSAERADVRTLARGVPPVDYERASFRDTVAGRPSIAFGIDTILEHRRTRHQELLLFESDSAGRVLALDGAVRTTSLDASPYYETLVHPALFAHPHPLKVAIVGGVDLHTLTEVLQHDIRHVDFIEADEEAARIAEKYYDEVRGSIDDPRVTMRSGDALTALRSCSDIDVAFVDPADRVGTTTNEELHALLDALDEALAPDAMVVLPGGAAQHDNARLQQLVIELQRRFAHVELLWTAAATTPGSLTTFVCASQVHNPREVRRATNNVRTEWYDTDMHDWSFLPAPLRRRLFI